MNSFRFLGLAVLVPVVNQLYGQQVDIGIFPSTTASQMEIRIRPDYAEGGTVSITYAQFTVKWLQGSTITSISGSPVSPFNFQPVGTPVADGGYYYQLYTTSGVTNTTWTANQVIPVLTFTFASPPCPQFEIANDEYVNRTSVHKEYGFEVNNAEKTGIIYQSTAQQPSPGAAGTITGTSVVCQGQSGVAYSIPAVSDASGYVWTYTGTGASISGSSASITISFNTSSTSGTLSVHGVNGCGNGTESPDYDITVNPLSVGGTASTVSPTICSGSNTTINLTGQTGTIQWQQSANGSTGWGSVTGGSGGTASAYTTPGLTTTTYYRAAVTSGICTFANSNTVTVTVNALPLVDAGTDMSIPYNTVTTISGATVTGTATLSYSWTPSASFVNATQLHPATVSLTTVASYTLTATDGNGCSNSDQMTINLTGIPITINPTATPSAICPGSSVQLNANASGGSGSLSYSWTSDPAGFTSALENPVAYPGATTTYTVQVSDDSHTVTGTTTVTVNPNPATPANLPAKEICASQSIPALTVTVGLGETADWYTTASGGTATATGTLSYTPSHAGYFYAQARNINTGCVSTNRASAELIIYTNPAAPVSGGNKIICAGQSIPALTVTVGAAETADWYTASSGGTASATGTLSYIPSGTGTWYVQARNTVTGCVSVTRIAITLTISLPAAPVSGGNKTICSGQAIPVLTVSVGTGETADWYTAPSGGSALATGTLSYTTSVAGTWYAQARNTTGGCLSTTRTAVTLTINSKPTAPVSGGNRTICANLSIPALTVTTGIGATADWYAVSSGGTASATGTLSYIPPSAGTYYAEARDTASGCVSTSRTAVTLTVNSLPAAPVNAGNKTICANQSIPALTVTTGTGETADWYTAFSGGTASATGTLSYYPPSAGTYYAEARNMSSGCMSTTRTAVSLTVNAIPLVYAGADKSIPYGAFTTISDASASGAAPLYYSWTPAASFVNSALLYPVTTNLTASNNYTLTVTDGNSCSNSDQMTISITGGALAVNPSATSSVICTGRTVQVNANASGGSGSYAYSWTSSPAGYTSAQATNTVSPAVTTTYFVQVYDGFNFISGSVTVTVIADVAAPVSGGNKTICANQSVLALTVTTGTGETADWYAASSGGTALATGTLSYTPPGAGTYYAEARNTIAGCVSATRTAVILAINTLPSVYAGADRSIPYGSFTIINDATATGTVPLSYSWTPATSFVNATLINPVTKNLGASGIYTLTVTDGNSCNNSDQVTIVISGTAQTVNPSATPSTVCTGNSIPVQLYSNVSGGSGSYTWSWTSNPAGFSSALANPSVTPAVTTTYTVQVNDGYNSVSGNVTVTVIPVPAAPLSGGNKAICSGQTIPALTVTTGTGETADWYASSSGGSALATGTLSYTPSGAGTYYAETRNSTAGCLSASRTVVTMTINILPLVYAGADKIIPYGTATTISDATASGTAPLSYSWTPAISFVNANVLNPVTKNLGASNIYTLTVTNGNNCSNSDQVAINITGSAQSVNPTANPSTVCAGSSVQLYANASGGSGSYTYLWTSNPAGFSSVQANPVASPVVTTTYTVQVNDGFNSVSGNVTVTVIPDPAAPVSGGNKTFCANQSVPGLTVSAGSGETVDWYATSSGGAVLATGTLSYSPPGAGTFFAEARNVTAGCVSATRTPVTLTVNALPVVYAGADKSIPYGTSTTISDATASGTAPLSYSWTPGASFVNTTLLNPVTRNLGTSNVYTLTVTNGNNCSNSDQVAINITGDALTVNPSATTSMVCSGTPVQLNANASGGSGYYTYSWTSNPAGLTSSQANPAVSPAVTTTYTVQVNDGFNSVSGNVTVTVIPYPPAPVSGGNKTICINQSIPALTVIVGTGETADWYAASSGGSALATGTLNYTPSGTGTWYVQARNTTTGCVSSTRTPVSLMVSFLPSVYAGADRSISYGTTTTISDATASGTAPLTYSWTPAASFVNATHLNPLTKNLTASNNYTLTVTNGNNCSASDQVTINVTGNALAVNPTGAPSTFCSGTSIQLNADASGGSGSYTYSWTSNPSGFSSAVANPAASPAVTTTFTVQVNDGFNSVSGNVTVTVNPAPAAPVSGGNKTICANHSIPALTVTTGTGETADWYTSSSGGTVMALGTLSYTPPGEGTLYAEARNKTTGCVSTTRTAVTMTSSPAPAAPVSGGNKTICSNQSVPALTVTVGTGETADWYAVSSGGSAVATGILTYIPSGAGTYYVETRNIAVGCVSATRTQVTLTVNAQPVVYAGADRSIPYGTSITISDATSSGTAPLSYSWTPSTFFVNATLLNPVTKNLNTSAIFTLNVINGNNCSSSDEVTINITGSPLTVNTSAIPSTVCSETSAKLYAIAWGGSGDYTYSWTSNPAGFVSSQANPTVSPGVTTTYTVQVNDGFNSVSGNTKVTVNQNPASPVSGVNRTICASQSIPALTVTTGTGETADWYATTSGGSALATGTLSYTPSGAGTWYAQARNSTTGCVSNTRKAVTLTVNPNPAAPVTGGNKSFCTNQSIPALTVSVGTGETADWYPSSSGGIALATGTLNYTPSGAGTWYAETRNITTGCVSTLRTAITMTGNPNPSAPVTGGNKIICANLSIPALTVTTGTGATADWYAESLGGSALATGTLSYTPPGAGTFYAEARNTTTGCVSTSRTAVILTVNAQPLVNAGADRSIPHGTSTTISDAFVSGTAPLSYSWTPASSFTNANLLHAVTKNLTASGTYTLTVTDGNNCSNSDQVAIAITGGPLAVNPSSTPASLCMGSSVQLNANVSGGSGSYTYLWTSDLTGFISAEANPVVSPAVATTYTVTVNDGFNSVSGNKTVTVNPNPAAPVSGGNITTCANQSIPSLKVTVGPGETVDWYAASSGDSVLANGTLIYIWYAQARNTTTGCVSTTRTAVTLTVNQNPAAPVSGGNRTICANQSIPAFSITVGAGETSDWYAASSGGTALASGTLSYTPSVAGTYYAEARNTATGCVSTARTAVTLTVNALPVVYAGADRSIPFGISTTISDATISGPPPLIYSWTPAASFVNAALPNPVTKNLTVSDIYTLTVTDGNSCSTSDQVTITIAGNALEVSPSAIPSTGCGGTYVQLNDNASGGSGSYTYSWTSNPAGFSSAQANPVVSPIVTTTYTVQVNDGFNSVSGNVTVTVIPTPSVPVTGGNRTICANQSIPALTVSVGTGETADWYTASSGGTALATGTLSYTPSGAGTWYPQARNTITGCVSTMRTAVTLTVNTLPVVYAGTDKSIPYGTSTTISDAAASGTTPLYYSWTPAASFVNATLSNPVTKNLTATNIYTLTVTDGKNCSNSDQATITITGSPIANPTVIPGSACEGSSVQLNANALGGSGLYTYSWTSNPVGFSSVQANPAASPAVTTTYTVQVNDGFNSVSGNVTVTVIPNPAAPVTGGNKTTCGTQSIPALTVTVGTGETADWYAVSSGGSALGLGTLGYTPSGAGTWYAQTRNTTTGCVSTTRTAITLTVNPTPAAPVSGGNKAICTKQSISALTVTVGTGETADWYAAPSGGSSLATGTLSYIPSGAETFYAEARNTTTGCVSAIRTPVILVINSLPAVNAGADMILCNGQKVKISDAIADNVSSITWTTSGTGKLTGSNSLNPEYQPSSGEYGLVRFILSGKGSGGCSETVISDTLMVTYQKPLIVDAGKDTSILANTTAILSVKVGNGSGNYTYQWSPGSSVVNNNKAVTETIPLTASTQFLITAKDVTSGCSAEDDIRITVEESIDDMLLITNGITPNGDGNNDVWKIRGIDSFPDNEVIIFNRWGDRIKMLKHYDNVNVFWDGTNEHGKLVPDGTYYYVLTIKDRKTYKGWIQLKSSL